MTTLRTSDTSAKPIKPRLRKACGWWTCGVQADGPMPGWAPRGSPLVIGDEHISKTPAMAYAYWNSCWILMMGDER